MTILEKIAEALRGRAGAYNRHEILRPSAVLWTDEALEWAGIVPALQQLMPELLVLGEFDAGVRTGPAIWLRCAIAGALPDDPVPEETTPILYLPGVSRGRLRAIEECPRELQPLAELQYRGEFWSQVNGRDWTWYAFLKSSDGGLGLDVSRDQATLDAIRHVAVSLGQAHFEDLQGRRLEAEDFHALIVRDLPRDMLTWMSDPDRTRGAWGDERWAVFCESARSEYGFDPETEGILRAGEHLGDPKGPWKRVWRRFCEAPRRYPGVRTVLERAAPNELLLQGHWPQVNRQAEDALRAELEGLGEMSCTAVGSRLRDLAQEHESRTDSPWAELGEAELARAVRWLARLAEATSELPAPDSLDGLGAWYAERGHIADWAALRSLEHARSKPSVTAIQTAVCAAYQPWLQDVTDAFQKAVKASPYPSPEPLAEPEPGTVLLFADGLRMDLAVELQTMLKARGLTVDLARRWAALPTATPTCKPAVSPIAHRLTGDAQCEDFTPAIAAEGNPLTSPRFRGLLEADGWQPLHDGDLGDPSGRGWIEVSKIDSHGHAEGWKLSRRIDEELREIADAVRNLLGYGWRRVLVVTDHGWLLLPGGLPKTHLNAALGSNRWSRCSQLKQGTVFNGLSVPWHWSTEIQIAVAPGISTFYANQEYSHGGLSLQECVIPMLSIYTDGHREADIRIEEVEWKGMRCRITVTGGGRGLEADLRVQPAGGPSIALGRRPLDDFGTASLVVPDDQWEGEAVYAVLVDDGGTVVAQSRTRVGDA